MTMKFISTRGTAPHLDLRGVTMTGLAADGGLYVPERWPVLSTREIMDLHGAPYQDIAFYVMQPFFDGVVPDADLKSLIAKATAGFNDPAVAPLKQLDDRHYVLELFHGPTLAFKDIALQFLGHTFEYFLAQQKTRMTVVGATSGDTGSAALAALAGRANIDVFILYPNKGPSDIQRKQMTCVDAPNVHALAVDGSFDDCQALVKSLFADSAFRAQHNLAAVNSINWLRILAQMVYYVATSARLGADRPVSFVVPTGNFGNIYAAYAATQCGVMTSKLAVASNANDILTRFFTSGSMKAETVQGTLSPSMDIQISSNFERLLFDLCGRDSAKLTGLMQDMQTKGGYVVSPMQLGMARQLFTAARADDVLTLKTIKDVYDAHGYILDPHSAVGMAAATLLSAELPDPVVTLACAHPAKFPATIDRAIGGCPRLPRDVAALMAKPERTELVSGHIDTVKSFIATHVTV